MKLTKPMCRKVGIYNPYDYALLAPYIAYHAQDNSRGGRGAYWIVCQRHKNFSDDYWTGGGKVFYVFGNKEDALLSAMQWMRDHKLIEDELVKTPFGTWMERWFVELRNAQIATLIKDKENARRSEPI